MISFALIIMLAVLIPAIGIAFSSIINQQQPSMMQPIPISNDSSRQVHKAPVERSRFGE